MAKRGAKRFGIKIDTKWDALPMSEQERSEKMCGDKELRSRRDAETQAQLQKMSAYKCPYCEYWHIGGKA